MSFLFFLLCVFSLMSLCLRFFCLCLSGCESLLPLCVGLVSHFGSRRDMWKIGAFIVAPMTMQLRSDCWFQSFWSLGLSCQSVRRSEDPLVKSRMRRYVRGCAEAVHEPIKFKDLLSIKFIEYVGCCCNGVKNQKSGKKRKSVSISACKDASSVHPAITKSCEALAQLPPYMSLDTSVHGEVVILSQPRWIHISHTADDSKLSNEEFKGTRVLIPVLGGLVELFSTEHVSEDESIIQYVQCQCNGSETETLSNSTITSDGPFYPLLEKTLDTLLSSITQFNISPDSTPGSVSQATPFTVKEESEGSQKGTKKHCKSKNLLTERNRRKRISDGMLILRSIVPKITKLHNAATLSDAVDYILELQNEQRKLLDELENSDEYSSDFEPTSFKTSNQEHSTFSPTKSSLSQAQVEVNQISAGNYLLRVESQQSRGVITRLLEAVGSLDVAVVDVNATVCNGRMSSNIIVQTKNEEVQEKDLREHLMRC